MDDILEKGLYTEESGRRVCNAWWVHTEEGVLAKAPPKWSISRSIEETAQPLTAWGRWPSSSRGRDPKCQQGVASIKRCWELSTVSKPGEQLCCTHARQCTCQVYWRPHCCWARGRSCTIGSRCYAPSPFHQECYRSIDCRSCCILYWPIGEYSDNGQWGISGSRHKSPWGWTPGKI